MKTFIRNIKNSLVRKTYSIFSSSLDRHYSLFFESLAKKKGMRNSQALFTELHRISLLGMNYGNSSPESNGEYYLIDALSKKMKDDEDLVFFDVGANVGDYTLELKTKFKKAKIHCFEPSLETFENLKKRTKGSEGILYNNIGLGESEKEVILYKNSDISALASIYNRNLDYLNLKLDVKEKIKLTTLDDFCLKNKIDNIDFLKLDVEGNEYNTFQGAKNMLSSKKIKYIQFEMGGCNLYSKTSWQELFEFLQPNYKVFRILKDGLYEFKDYSEFDEVYVYANYFAEAKK